MKIVSTNVYVGPNVWAHFRVIRHVLDLGELENWPTGRLGDAFLEPLLEALPGLHEHGCSYREPAAFIRPGDRLDVVGSGGITVIDPTELSYSSMDQARRGDPVSLIGVKLHILIAGGTFDAVSREASPESGE